MIIQFDKTAHDDMPHFTIEGTLPSLNEYLGACRRHAILGSKMKKDTDTLISYAIRKGLGKYKPTNPIILHFIHYEPNKRRDKDNINGYCRKSCLDALQKCKVIPNDGWADVENFTQDFFVDKLRPRIEVYIEEVENG